MRILHPFHLLTPSVWPLASSLSLFNLAVCLTALFNGVSWAGFFSICSLGALTLSMAFWWRDVTQEAA